MGRFQLHLKDKKPDLHLDISIVRSGKYTCPLNGQDFRGSCEIRQCHCNLPVNKARCLQLFYPGKTEFDKWDIMFALNLNEKKLRQRYQIGKTQAYHIVLFHNVITRLRNNNKHEHCPYCGVLKHKAEPCSNLMECRARFDFARQFIGRSFLRYREIKAQLRDVWLLLFNKSKLQAFSDEGVHLLDLTIPNLLGADPEIMELSNLHRPFLL